MTSKELADQWLEQANFYDTQADKLVEDGHSKTAALFTGRAQGLRRAAGQLVVARVAAKATGEDPEGILAW